MIQRQLFWFGVAGVIGFAVDAGVLYVTLACGAGPFLGRIISFLCAVWVTWQINRRHTFPDRADRGVLKEFGRYLLSSLGGASVNYAAYSVVILTAPESRLRPLIAVACGSFFGMFVNFLGAKLWAFKR